MKKRLGTVDFRISNRMSESDLINRIAANRHRYFIKRQPGSTVPRIAFYLTKRLERLINLRRVFSVRAMATASQISTSVIKAIFPPCPRAFCQE